MKKDIALELQGYAVRQIRLEQFVDQASYQPVITALIDLNSSGEHPFMASPDSRFFDSLSPKSTGLMLTSALVAGNEALYAPLYSYAASSVVDMYPQDLPSLLGGNQAPSALSEMTRRATKSIGALQDFSFGLTQISQVSQSSGLLSGVRAHISSSSWVEAFPEYSRGLMTLVSAAPAKLEIEPLKTKALSRYLKAGLKLASVASVLAGIGLAGLYGASLAHQSAAVSLADMGARPIIDSIGADGKVEQMKIAKFGEVGSLPLAKFYFDKISGQSVSDAITSFSDHSRQGVAMKVYDGAAPGINACLIQSHQTAPLSKDGNFYLFTDNTQGIADKNLFDFFYESHETSHCFSLYDSSANKEHQSFYDQAYSISLNEISSDLGAVLDYMRVNGNGDIYHNHIRPFRVANVNDVTHKTAWALDIILKDVDPAMVHGKSKEEIPLLTRSLMERNFQANDGSFNPGRLSSAGTTQIDTPAANALFKEIIASKHIHNQRYPELVKALRDDIRDTMSMQQAKYAGIAPKEVIEASKAGYEALALEFNLEPLKPLNVTPVEVAKPMESLLSAYR